MDISDEAFGSSKKCYVATWNVILLSAVEKSILKYDLEKVTVV
jgi:hypothetical protein